VLTSSICRLQIRRRKHASGRGQIRKQCFEGRYDDRCDDRSSYRSSCVNVTTIGWHTGLHTSRHVWTVTTIGMTTGATTGRHTDRHVWTPFKGLRSMKPTVVTCLNASVTTADALYVPPTSGEIIVQQPFWKRNSCIYFARFVPAKQPDFLRAKSET